jgi:PKD repeat protein
VTGAVNKTYTVDWGDGTAVSSVVVPLPACGASFVTSTAERTLAHSYAAVGNYTAKLKVERSDTSEFFTRTQAVVADKTALQYLYRLARHTLSNTSLSLAAAAESLYTLMNGYAKAE